MYLTPKHIGTDLRTAVALLRAVCKRQYPFPWKTGFWVALCVIYFLSPIDVLPDIIPILGFADDGAFILFVLLTVHNELKTFRLHQQKHTTILEAQVINEDKHA